MMPLISTIYGLTDPETGGIRYVGKTSQGLKKRLQGHLRDKTQCHRVSWIKSLRDKGLTPSIITIEEVPNDDWQSWEMYWIEVFREAGYSLVNSTSGGDGINNPGPETLQKMREANMGRKLTEEHRRKISEGNKGKNLGRKHSKEAICKSSEARKGNKYALGHIATLEARRKMSEASHSRKRTERSKECCQKISEALKGNKNFLGHKHTPETRRNLSEHRKGKALSDEHRRKLSESHKKSPRAIEHLHKIKESRKGIPLSEEHRRKISAVLKAKFAERKRKLGK